MEEEIILPNYRPNLKTFVLQLMDEQKISFDYFSNKFKINLWRDVINGKNESWQRIDEVARCFGFPSQIEFLQEMKNRNLYS